MGENLNSRVNQVLGSPELRSCIANCLHSSTSNASTNLNTTQNYSQITPTPPATVPGVRNELRRLFPSVRPCSSSYISGNNNNVGKRRRVVRGEKMQFMKEVILLKNPSDKRTVTGFRKAKLYEEGYALSAVEFDKSWRNADICLKIAELFQNKLDGSDFEFLIPMCGYLVKPNLNDSELDGCTLSKIFSHKSLYIRPLQSVLRYDIEQKHEEDLTSIFHSEIQNQPSVEYVESHRNQPDLDGANASSLSHSLDVKPSSSHEVLIDPMSLNEILSHLSKNINEENTTFFNVYREDIFNCCIRALRRKSFSPFNKINVTFTDCDNKSEGAIDVGGPKREMFRLILTYLDSNSHLFGGENNNKFIVINKEALENRHYYEAGRLIALAIVYVGLGPRFFSELFFNLLSRGSDNVDPTVNDIADKQIKSEIQMAMDASDLQALRNIILEGSFIRLAGWEILNDFETKSAMVKDVINFYVVERCKKCLDQFIEGLEILNVYSYIKQCPEYFIEMFCDTTEGALTLTKIDTLFCIRYSEEGSNKRTLEGRIAAFCKDYLLDCSENEADDSNLCTLEEILIFCTGAKVIPSLGFPSEPAVKFLHEDTCPYPKGNTCALELHLPTIHADYETFKTNVSFGIKNGMTFGYA